MNGWHASLVSPGTRRVTASTSLSRTRLPRSVAPFTSLSRTVLPRSVAPVYLARSSGHPEKAAPVAPANPGITARALSGTLSATLARSLARRLHQQRKRNGPLPMAHAAPDPALHCLTSGDIARSLKVDLKTVHRWVRRGRMRGHRTKGGHLRFRRIEVVRFLRERRLRIPDDIRVSILFHISRRNTREIPEFP